MKRDRAARGDESDFCRVAKLHLAGVFLQAGEDLRHEGGEGVGSKAIGQLLSDHETFFECHEAAEDVRQAAGELHEFVRSPIGLAGQIEKFAQALRSGGRRSRC